MVLTLLMMMVMVMTKWHIRMAIKSPNQRDIIFGFVLILIKFRLTAQTKRSVT